MDVLLALSEHNSGAPDALWGPHCHYYVEFKKWHSFLSIILQVPSQFPNNITQLHSHHNNNLAIFIV